MTPEELNRKIHAVRGECYHKFAWTTVEEPAIPIRKCLKCHAIIDPRNVLQPFNKDYPGNIKDACEAVRSIPESKRNAFGFEIAQKFNVLGSWPNIIYHLLSDEDAPRKICLAYIEVMG